MKDIKIIVVSHKAYSMPDDPIYIPVEVGAANRSQHFFSHRIMMCLDWFITVDSSGSGISLSRKNFRT